MGKPAPNPEKLKVPWNYEKMETLKMSDRKIFFKNTKRK
jgi:hypothetical protein